MFAIKPIFIVGAGHSGTSILYRMLAAHPDFAWFSQYSCRGGEIPNRFWLPFYQYFNRTLRSFFKHNWAKEDSGLKIVPRPGDAEQIWDYIFLGSNEEIIGKLKKIFEKERGNWRKNFILSKNIRFYRYLHLFKKAYPEAKFIHIIRDGRALVLSRKYKIGAKGENRTKEPIENFFKKAIAWVRAVEIINQQKENLSMFELRYEDFCNDVHGYFKKILEYSGLDIAKFPFNRFPKALTPINDKWFKIAAPGEAEKLAKIQKEILKKYGYT